MITSARISSCTFSIQLLMSHALYLSDHVPEALDMFLEAATG